MHYTLHLTNRCNMSCDYCYVNTQKQESMSFDTAKKAVDLAAAQGNGSVGIIFFGGEPLLENELMQQVIQYCRSIEVRDGVFFHFKVTTNGILLSPELLRYFNENGVLVALSHDGIDEAHDRHRRDKTGNDTFMTLESKIDLLLAYQPYAPVLMTINPDTAGYYAASVKYLYDKGFKYLICSMNYAGDWSENPLDILKEQYLLLSDFYLEKTLKEEKFYLSPFEVKISSHINKNSYCKERCELGKKQISVGPDGTLYPCVQFVGAKNYVIGHVNEGINEEIRNNIYSMNELDKGECEGCAIKKRCNNHCGCMNWQATGSISKVSSVLCAHERIVMPIADRLAGKLYKRRNPLFIQKHYNDLFPLISLVEDKLYGDKNTVKWKY